MAARLTDDGLGDLCGYDLPPHRVAAAMERLTAIARAAKNDGDLRRIDQLRADAATRGRTWRVNDVDWRAGLMPVA